MKLVDALIAAFMTLAVAFGLIGYLLIDLVLKGQVPAYVSVALIYASYVCMGVVLLILSYLTTHDAVCHALKEKE